MKPEESISDYVNYGMVVHSEIAKRLGIKNEVDPKHLEAVKNTAKKYDVIANGFGQKPNINCFYRSLELNNNTPGSSLTSQHCKGEAMDLDMDHVNCKENNSDLFHWIRQNMDWDQMILEGNSHGEKNPDWVHVSFKLDGKNRKQLLKMERIDGKPH